MRMGGGNNAKAESLGCVSIDIHRFSFRVSRIQLINLHERYRSDSSEGGGRHTGVDTADKDGHGRSFYKLFTKVRSCACVSK